MSKIIPLIGLDASLRAFAAAKAEYNDSVQGEFNIDSTKAAKYFGTKTAVGAMLRPVHYAIFYQIVNEYRNRIDRLPSGVNEFDPNQLLGLWMTRGDVASKIGIHPRTVYNLLQRLEKAKILLVKNHGNKKPLEIRFDKNVLIVFDKKDPNFIPVSKFLNCSLSDHPFEIGKTLPHKKEVQRTLNNITITESGVSVQVSNSGLQIGSDGTESNEISIRTASETVVPPAEPDADGDFLQRTHKAEQEGTKNSISDIVSRAIARELAKKSSAGAIARNLAPIEVRRPENLNSVANEFVIELLRRIFPNRFFTSEYRGQIAEYAEKNYFADCETMQAVDNRYKNNLLPRILIAEKWLKNYKREDGSGFDTTYFFPLAYLNVEHFGNGVFSFRNTAKFLKDNKKYQKLNGYNRKLTPDLRLSLNTTVRALQNNRISYDTALQRINSMCIAHGTLEPKRQFIARTAGIYAQQEIN